MNEIRVMIEEWCNKQLATNWRWLRSWTYVRDLIREYAESYYYDEITYQAIKFAHAVTQEHADKSISTENQRNLLSHLTP